MSLVALGERRRHTKIVYTIFVCRQPEDRHRLMASRHPEAYRRMLARLRGAREERGLRQQDVADSLGIHQVDVSRLENGERRLDPVELAELADLYGKTLDFLVRGDVDLGT